jgi:hypothetical protein
MSIWKKKRLMLIAAVPTAAALTVAGCNMPTAPETQADTTETTTPWTPPYAEPTKQSDEKPNPNYDNWIKTAEYELMITRDGETFESVGWYPAYTREGYWPMNHQNDSMYVLYNGEKLFNGAGPDCCSEGVGISWGGKDEKSEYLMFVNGCRMTTAIREYPRVIPGQPKSMDSDL